MRRVLFVTNDYHLPLYSELQQKYAIKSAGVATSLRVAATLLQSGEELPDAIVLGHDLTPPTKAIEFVRKGMQVGVLRNLTWIVLLDRNVAFMGNELSGVARTLVFQDTTAESLAAALDAQPVQTRRTRTLAVINTKGGTGKTSIIVNLADVLACRGLRTLIMDADVADGNVALALGVPPAAPTIDMLAREISRGKDVYQVISHYLYERGPNLFVLPAPDRRDYGQDYLNEVTATAILNAIGVQRFDVALIDLPGNVRATPFVAPLVLSPHAYFYLIYPLGRTFGAKGFDGAAQIISGLNARERSRMVVIESGDGEAWSEAELLRTWSMPMAGKLPHDPIVEKSQAMGKTVRELLASQKGLGAQFSRGLSTLAGHRAYGVAIEELADWIIKNELALST